MNSSTSKLDTLSAIASQYVGKTETPNNSGFSDKVFQKRMENVGWGKGQAWCCYFAELCLMELSISLNNGGMARLVKQLFSGGSTATYKNVSIYVTAVPLGNVKILKKPEPNCVAIFRHGNGWEGHTAIVTEVLANGSIKTIEGNTNDIGGREGYIVARKTRNPLSPFNPKGLNLVGYFSFL